ncbi:hypothetical protein [Botrimarina colliarenosi]|uniref:hypothetical protein n=1 Tax=Botrimarina colliarenosi TaxID=2528001 RepID=UPI0011B79150|nr:hypothetical protein [Botrimarina colliarenosi]
MSQAPDANEVGAGPVNVWTFDAGGTSPVNGGSFLGNSAANAGGASGAGAGNPAWGIYANSGAFVTATADIAALAGRNLSLAGDSVSLDFDNGWIDASRFVGVQFFDSFGVVVSQFSFTGGNANYSLDDVVTTDTGIGFTGDGFEIKLTLTSSTGDYTFEANGLSFDSRTLNSFIKDIASIQVFNASAGNSSNQDLFFNTLSISAVPEVSPTTALSLLAYIGFAIRSHRGCS